MIPNLPARDEVKCGGPSQVPRPSSFLIWQGQVCSEERRVRRAVYRSFSPFRLSSAKIFFTLKGRKILDPLKCHFCTIAAGKSQGLRHRQCLGTITNRGGSMGKFDFISPHRRYELAFRPLDSVVGWEKMSTCVCWGHLSPHWTICA